MGEDRLDRPLLREKLAVVIGQIFPFPLIRILRKDRHCGRVHFRDAVEHRVQATFRREVRADEIAMFFGVAEAGHWLLKQHCVFVSSRA